MDTLMNKKAIYRCQIAMLVFVVAVGCGDDPVQLNPNQPAAVLAEAGNGQIGQIGTVLPADLVARVISETGAGLPDVRVEFRVETGSGSIAREEVVTDGQGVANAGRWTLGETVGAQRVEAFAAGLEPAVFTSAAAGIPASLVMVAGDGQRVEAGTAVQVLPEVQVLDADGAPLSNILVTFLSDDGVVTGAEVLTDGQGRAAVGGWTAGTAKGQQELFAMVPGGEIKGSPAVFGVFAEAGPPVALLAAEGDGQNIEASSVASISPRVRAEDVYGNGVTGIRIRFEVTEGGGSLHGGDQTTDKDGQAAVTGWITGPGETGSRQAVTATAVTGGPSFVGKKVDFAATVVPAFFGIRLVHTPVSQITDALRLKFQNTKLIWEAVIGGDLPKATVSGEETV